MFLRKREMCFRGSAPRCGVGTHYTRLRPSLRARTLWEIPPEVDTGDGKHAAQAGARGSRRPARRAVKRHEHR
jgi:hypothetical protein